MDGNCGAMVQPHDKGTVGIHSQRETLHDRSSGMGTCDTNPPSERVMAGRKSFQSSFCSVVGIQKGLEFLKKSSQNLRATGERGVFSQFQSKACGGHTFREALQLLGNVDSHPQHDPWPTAFRKNPADFSLTDEHVVGPLQAGVKRGNQSPDGPHHGDTCSSRKQTR
jgi:hypothetical protein